ncbi:uncharacterized protein LOC132804921 [Ziziphus jujuba]|uniref:Uncharacterized protein LOC132804921 n=1 Tax=Ziziphus jujuba TaxID=326968 RepID=A0ABM4AEX7_ZIZJJ|nr:uncharacterized protein LOC132804921 [Ziziphus jujuba]
MESKTNKMNRNFYLLVLALIGLLASVIVTSCFHEFQMIWEKDIRDQFAECAVQLHGSVATSIKDGLITMTIKFLHFFTAKWMQFRYLSPLQPLPFSTSNLFWFSFARSISSMPDLPFS